VRMDARCVSGTRLRWLTDGRPAEVLRTEKSSDATFFLLATGRVVSERVTIAVTRADLDGTVIGVVETATIPAPRPRVTLELPKHGPIDFIPTNRDAVLTVVGAGEHARFVPLAVEGAYAVTPLPTTEATSCAESRASPASFPCALAIAPMAFPRSSPERASPPLKTPCSVSCGSQRTGAILDLSVRRQRPD